MAAADSVCVTSVQGGGIKSQVVCWAGCIISQPSRLSAEALLNSFGSLSESFGGCVWDSAERCFGGCGVAIQVVDSF